MRKKNGFDLLRITSEQKRLMVAHAVSSPFIT